MRYVNVRVLVPIFYARRRAPIWMSASEKKRRWSSRSRCVRVLPWSRNNREIVDLAETPDEQSVALEAIVTDDVDCGFALGGVDHLPDAQKGSTVGQFKHFCEIGVGDGGVDFLVGVGQFYAIVVPRGQRIANFFLEVRSRVRKTRPREDNRSPEQTAPLQSGEDARS